MAELTNLPEGWLNSMKLQFEENIAAPLSSSGASAMPKPLLPVTMTMLRSDRADLKRKTQSGKSVFGHCSHVISPFVNSVLPINFLQVFLSEVRKEGTNKTKHWASTYGNLACLL